VTWIDRLIERLVHHGTPAVTPSKDNTPADVLDALEWADTDSGEDLVQRAEKIKGTPARV
jgi:hypothetical protein